MRGLDKESTMANKANEKNGDKKNLKVPNKTIKDLSSRDAEHVKGGHKPPPPPPKKPCWVARAVYGESNPRWLLFRAWLLDEAPEWLRNLYLRRGESFALRIEPYPKIKSIIRWFMDRAIDRNRTTTS